MVAIAVVVVVAVVLLERGYASVVVVVAVALLERGYASHTITTMTIKPYMHQKWWQWHY